jgi:membrane-bound lytic murein transglycosylase D
LKQLSQVRFSLKKGTFINFIIYDKSIHLRSVVIYRETYCMHLSKVLKLSILLLFIIPAINTFGQRAYFTEVADSEDYYKANYARNLDSLHASWVVQNTLGGPLANKAAQLGTVAVKPTVLFKAIHSPVRSEYHPRIGEMLDMYLAYEQKTHNAMAVFNFYRKDIEGILAKYNIPNDLVYMPFVVSAMNPKARTETGASGYWQLMYPVARKYGLTISSYVDDRQLLLASTEAAAQYLQQLNSIYNNWELSMAAFMCSPSNVNKSIRRANQNMSFDSIVQFLPNYAKDVSYGLIAAKLLFESNQDLKIEVPVFNPMVDCDTVEVSQQLHFQQVEAVLGVDARELRFLNPQYKHDIVPAMNKVYHVLLPKGKLESFNTHEDSIYQYKDSVLFQLSKRVILPPPAKGRKYAKAEPERIPENTVRMYYSIKSGDNLGYVADWYDVSIKQLQEWNNIYDPRRLQIGQKIKIYVPKSKRSYYAKIETMSFDQKQKLSGAPATTSSNKSNVSSGKSNGSKSNTSNDLGSNYTIHTVKSGESAYIIALKYPGVSAEDILRWNNIKDPKSLRVGQKLKIKKL